MLAQLEQAKKELNARMEKEKSTAESMGKDSETSIQALNKLIKDRAETTVRMSQLEEARGYYEGRLKAAEDEAEALRKERVDSAKRIAELEAQNEYLKAKLNRTSPSGDLEERRGSRKRRSKRSGSEKSLGTKSKSDRSLTADPSKVDELTTSWHHNSLKSWDDWKA